MVFFGATDKGKKRKNNEDRFACCRPADNAVLLVVCDGMGGEAGGEIAAQTAVDVFLKTVNSQVADSCVGGKYTPEDAEEDMTRILGQAVDNANTEVLDTAAHNKRLEGMGATLTAILSMTSPDVTYAVNLGDSRAYVVGKKRIVQITKDHSYIQYLVDTGKITAEQAEKRTDRNIIVKAVGISPTALPDMFRVERRKGEMLLLCTDGLSGMLSDEDIQGIVSMPGATPETAVDRLIKLANDAGGDDNITVIVAE